VKASSGRSFGFESMPDCRLPPRLVTAPGCLQRMCACSAEVLGADPSFAAFRDVAARSSILYRKGSGRRNLAARDRAPFG